MDCGTMEKILAYIDAHIQEKISLRDLSDIAGYSPFYFSKLFSEEMGMPVTGYIRIRKLQHAIVSLLEGQKVLDVAMKYSFDSHEGFTRSFKQLFGSTPKSVRKHLTSYTVPDYIVTKPTDRGIYMETKTILQNMHQLVFEVLENSLDESRAGFCTEVIIELLANNRIKITDNGRGMPLSSDMHANNEVLEKILTGKPITNEEYSQMGDLAQAGMQTVNSLCESLQIKVDRDGKQYQQDYIRGIAQHELYIREATRPSGTEIILTPDKTIFGDTTFSKDVLTTWVVEKSMNAINFAVRIVDAS